MNRVGRSKGPTPTASIGPVGGEDRKPAEKAAAGFGVTHGLHRQSPPAHPHTGMKVATILAPMPGLRIDFGENDRMDRGLNPSRSSLSFGPSFDSSWASPNGNQPRHRKGPIQIRKREFPVSAESPLERLGWVDPAQPGRASTRIWRSFGPCLPGGTTIPSGLHFRGSK